MAAHPEPTTSEELPEAHPSLVEQSVVIEAWLMTVDRRTGARFLENLAKVIAGREEMMHVLPIRRSAKARSAAVAERQALAALRQNMAVWLARLSAE